MIVLIILTALSVIGIGTVFWLLKNDTGATAEGSSTTITKDADQPKKETSPPKEPKQKFSILLSKLTKKKPPSNDTPEAAPLPSLKEYLNTKGNETAPSDKSVQTGTLNIKTTPTQEPKEEEALSEEEEKNIEKEIDLTSQLSELKEKYEKLDSLFNEKSSELEKAKESLDSELKNRKEFNKVKDLLEKELKDSKDKTHTVQTELNDTKTENERYKKRISQIEEKTTKLEKALLEKEDKINELVKRLQTFASSSTAATPPTVEQPETHPPSPEQKQPLEETAQEQAPPKPIEPLEKPEPFEPSHQPLGQPPTEEAETPSSSEEPSKENAVEEKTGGGETPPPPESNTAEANSNSQEEPEEEREPLKLQPDILAGEPQEDDTQATVGPEQSSPSETGSEAEGKLSQYLNKKKLSEESPQSPDNPSENQESNERDSNNSNGKEEQ